METAGACEWEGRVTGGAAEVRDAAPAGRTERTSGTGTNAIGS